MISRLGFVLACFLATTGLAPQLRAEEPNPYVAFYAELWQEARLDVDKLKVQLDYDVDRLARLEEGYTHGAIPEASVLDARRQVKADRVEIQILESKARRAKAQLDIVRQRVAAGEAVSMCGSD